MMKSRKSWVPKLRPELTPRIEVDPRDGQTMLIPTPMLVAEEIRRVRRGRLLTPAQLRDRLAVRLGAARTCPLTTGIFLNILAGAAEEQLSQGRRPVAPWWRVIAENGRLDPKRPPGVACQAARLRGEGHRVQAGTTDRDWQVVGFCRVAPSGTRTTTSRARRRVQDAGGAT